MAKTSFTVHLDLETAEKLQLMKEQNPNFSRNALIRLAVKEFRLDGYAHVSTDLEAEIYQLKHHINAFHKQNNPDWKRKKSLPYHFADEYNDIPNYTEFQEQ